MLPPLGLIGCVLSPACDKASDLQRRQSNLEPSTSTYLRRTSHAAAVAEYHLLIDGGYYSYLGSDGPVFENLTSTLVLDLSKDFINTSASISSIQKPFGGPQGKSRDLFYNEPGKFLYTGIVGQAEYGRSKNIWTFALGENGSGFWNETDIGISESRSRTIPGLASGPETGWLLDGNDFDNEHTLSDLLFVKYKIRESLRFQVH